MSVDRHQDIKWLQTHILHHSQEQAFWPVKRRVDFLVEQAGKPVPKSLIENGTTSQFKRTAIDKMLLYILPLKSSTIYTKLDELTLKPVGAVGLEAKIK